MKKIKQKGLLKKVTALFSAMTVLAAAMPAMSMNNVYAVDPKVKPSFVTDDGLYSVWESTNGSKPGNYICAYHGSDSELTIPSEAVHTVQEDKDGDGKLEPVVKRVHINGIYDMTFEGNETLKSVTLSEGISRLENKAFSGCKNITEFRACSHKIYYTFFRQISLLTALKILAGRQSACKFSPCYQQNYARKSAQIFYVNTL